MSDFVISPARIGYRRVSGYSQSRQRLFSWAFDLSSVCVRGILSAFCLLFSAFSAIAQNTYPIAWVWPSNTTASAVMDQFPWLRLQPERVNLDLSLDGGATYEPLARGVESTYGTNVWHFSLPDKPHYLTTAGRVRISSNHKYRQPQTVVETSVVIAGIQFVAPPAAITNGANVTLRWTAAGAGTLVQLGTRVIGADTWVPQAVFASTDSNKGATTNSAVWAVSGMQAVPTEILLQSMTDPLCYRRVALAVVPGGVDP